MPAAEDAMSKTEFRLPEPRDGIAASAVRDARIEPIRPLLSEPAGEPAVGESPVAEPGESAAFRPFRWAPAHRRWVMLTDGLIIVGALLASQSVRFGGTTEGALGSTELLGGWGYWGLSGVLAISWLVALAVYGAWDPTALGTGAAEYRGVAVATGVVIAGTAIVSYLTDAEIARGFVGVAFPLGLIGLVAGRWVWRLLLIEYRRAGTHLSRVLVIGGVMSGPELAGRLRWHVEAGYQVVGLCVPGGALVAADQSAPQIDGFPVLGGIDDVYAAIRTRGIDTVAVASTGAFDTEMVKRLAWNLEGTDIRLVLSPALTDVAGPRIHVEPVAGLPLLDVQTPLFSGRKILIKSALDYGIASVAVVLLSPVFLVAAAAVLMSSGRPLFDRPVRVGRDGKLFREFRFRTCVRGTSAVSRIGWFIRRVGIDQSVQLLNVLTGSMSLVGTRAIDPEEEVGLDTYLERRIRLRPGIIGPTPAPGRNSLYLGDSLQLDLYYVENWSPSGDLVIIGQALRSMFVRARLNYSRRRRTHQRDPL